MTVQDIINELKKHDPTLKVVRPKGEPGYSRFIEVDRLRHEGVEPVTGISHKEYWNSHQPEEYVLVIE